MLNRWLLISTSSCSIVSSSSPSVVVACDMLMMLLVLVLCLLRVCGSLSDYMKPIARYVFSRWTRAKKIKSFCGRARPSAPGSYFFLCAKKIFFFAD